MSHIPLNPLRSPSTILPLTHLSYIGVLNSKLNFVIPAKYSGHHGPRTAGFAITAWKDSTTTALGLDSALEKEIMRMVISRFYFLFINSLAVLLLGISVATIAYVIILIRRLSIKIGVL